MAAGGRKSDDTKLLIALAEGNPVSATAEQAGVSERTAYRRLEDPSFRGRLHSMRSKMMATAVDKLTSTMQGAADTLANLLHSESDSIGLQLGVRLVPASGE